MRFWIFVLLILVACAPAGGGTAPALEGFYPTQAAVIQQTQAAPASMVQVFLRGVERRGKEALLEVCFTPPDASDWTLGTVHLLVGGEEMPFLGSALTEIVSGTGGHRRCEMLTFGIPPEMVLSAALLQVDALQVEPSPEDLCTLYLPKMAARLESQGVRADCVQSSQGWQVRILSYPSSLSEEQAQALIYDPANFALPGPWVFSLQFQP
ncbi:MAG: hypothetical protein WHS87_10145 [Anaerolineales bacterium]